MEIQIENLGPIKQGKIDLSKKLIIFTGKNNTGKSYLAYLIYGLYKIKELKNYLCSDENEFWNVVNNKKLITQIFASKNLVPIIKLKCSNSDKNQNLFLNNFSKNSIMFFPAERTAINMLAKKVFIGKASKLDEISQRILVEEDIESFIKSIKGDLLPRYPLGISDYIYFINDLSQIVKNDSEFYDFADEIESLLLQGKVSVSEYGDIKFKPAQDIQTLNIHLASSMVKSLSGLVLYFRHIAKPGDMFIIDEPELNLHPDSQLIVARILAKAVNKGFKIILSTHSDYIIKEFNNMIMLNNASKSDRKAIFEHYGYDTILNPETVGAYFLSESTIEPIEISETGFSVKTMDATIDSLDNAMEGIYYRLFEIK